MSKDMQLFPHNGLFFHFRLVEHIVLLALKMTNSAVVLTLDFLLLPSADTSDSESHGKLLVKIVQGFRPYQLKNTYSGYFCSLLFLMTPDVRNAVFLWSKRRRNCRLNDCRFSLYYLRNLLEFDSFTCLPFFCLLPWRNLTKQNTKTLKNDYCVGTSGLKGKRKVNNFPH